MDMMEAAVRIITYFSMLSTYTVDSVILDFSICHEDFNLNPSDGILKDHTFMWVGFSQYIHVTTGLPHHSKAPRVTLIHKQYAVGTANDLIKLPKNYKLGNIIFGDYERDEEDCDLKYSQLKMGFRCPRAYIEIPVVDITPHPEYSKFGVGNSLALVKLIRPMKSNYMLPICLPSIMERTRKKTNKVVFMVDYISSVPTDFDTEKMGKKTLKLYTHKECRRHRMKSNLGSEGVTHVLCSSGCGVRPGAPIATQSSQGAFELVGIAAGGAPCSRRSMRRRLNEEPPLYIDVYPYASWIINVITAYVLPHPYPQNFKLTDSGAGFAVRKKYRKFFNSKEERKGWRGRTYSSGNMCYQNLRTQRTSSYFYAEKFEVTSNPKAKLFVHMKFSAGIETTITCSRLLLPNRKTTPEVYGVGGYNITIVFDTEWFPYQFYFSLGLSGVNSSQLDVDEWIMERTPGFW